MLKQKILISFLSIMFLPNIGYSVNLDLANDALELSIGVEPNIVVLNDDSGSMDFGVLVNGNAEFSFNSDPNTFSFFNGLSYWHTYVGPSYDGVSAVVPPGSDHYTSFANTTPYAPSEAALIASGVAAPYLGVWRLWLAEYNLIHYNPNVTYTPWNGVDTNGNTYSNISPTNALYNPFEPTHGGLDLTTTYNYNTVCGFAACTAANAGANLNVTVNNFYPARYYLWTDSNSDNVVDATDAHTLIEIRTTGCTTGATCPTTFVRSEFSSATNTGRADCATNNGDGTVTCNYNEEIQNFSNWYSYYRKRDLVAKAAISNSISDAAFARIGYATINGNTNDVRTPVASMNISPGSGNKKILMDNIFRTAPGNGGTPLRLNLQNVGHYYECTAGNIFGYAASAPGSTNCPVEAAPKGTCQVNYTLLMTDGFYNGTAPTIGNIDGPGTGNTNFDGGAFADGFSNTLADVAMHFYERDLHSTLNDDVPVNARDINLFNGTGSLTADDSIHQHMTTYTIGFGVRGSISSMPSSPSSTTTAWPDPNNGNAERIDDLRHAAYNGRGDFISARNPQALEVALADVFSEFLAGEGAASSVAFNSQTIEGDSLVFRAFFNSSNHSGDLVAQKINSDGTLNNDVNGDPIFEWSAATRLDAKTGSSNDSRVIVTYNDNGASSDGIAFKWMGTSTITSAQMSQLISPQPGNITLPATVGEERLNYLRGHTQDEGPSFDDGEFRTREPIAGKLGDIVHSTPVFVGSPQFVGRDSGEFPGEFPGNTADLYSTYKASNSTRANVVYVGANDGMLHAFDAETGDELFAYVPNIVFNNLSQLTDPDYSHRFFVDQTPSINDIFMLKDGASTRSWNTVLVSGLEAGGKGYFALNITNPSTFAAESSAANNVMWEFTEADDGSVGNSDLGYSFSQPLIAMSNAEYPGTSGDNRWVAIFGNGYNSTSTDGDAALYILFIDKGQDGTWTASSDFIKISTGQGKAESLDGTTPNGIGGVRGIDIDANGTVDRVYAGDLQGNLYRFDISSATTSQWDNSSNQDIIFQAKYSSGFPRTTAQPITRRPVVINHPEEPGHIVIFSTGSWITTDDATSSSIQSIYGIWDDGSNDLITSTAVNNQLVEQSFTNHIGTEDGFTVRTLSNNDVAWDNVGANKVKGWYIDLNVPPAGSTTGIEYPGERAVRNLQLRGGFLFVNTVIPKNINPCTDGPGGYELAFNPVTGGSGTDIIFDNDNNGVFDQNDNVGNIDAIANIITGRRFDNSTPTDSAFIGNYRITQTSDKGSRSSNVNGIASDQAGRNSWRELIIK